ncbi:NifB/NifX family molybdenum-iron cluster-binding protein [Desulforhopalus sp. 52FAK]
MKIAITVWGNRISPVFDAASTLLFVELGDTEPLGRELKLFQPGLHESFITLLVENEVELLVCGAMCENAVNRVEAAGVEVISFLTGEVDVFIDGYLEGADFANFVMPGCRNGRCCRGKFRREKEQQ